MFKMSYCTHHSGSTRWGCCKKNLSPSSPRWKIITMVRRTTTGIIRAAHLVRRAADQTHRRWLYVAGSGNMESYIISPLIGHAGLHERAWAHLPNNCSTWSRILRLDRCRMNSTMVQRFSDLGCHVHEIIFPRRRDMD